MPFHHLSGAKIGFFTIESKQINDYLLKSGEKIRNCYQIEYF
jgi:hypothetical protein